VPAWRNAGTIVSTLRSLLSQQPLSPRRVIVVVSPGDDTAYRARSIAGVEVVEVAERLLAGTARNLGRGMAGDVDQLLFVDADCTLESGALSELQIAMQGQDLVAAGAGIDRDNPGLVSWLRHSLEFKELDRGAPVSERGPLASAALLCRADAFDRAGGFPDAWPGEDTALLHSLRAAGGRARLVPSARARHRHPAGLARALRHQWLLGAGSARARLSADMPGSRFARNPLLGLLLFPGRVGRGLAWFLRYRRSELALFLIAGPLYICGIAAWTIGFVATSWRESPGRGGRVFFDGVDSGRTNK
jgi:glycosyltransferase involved in cell wall biosynthesis